MAGLTSALILGATTLGGAAIASSSQSKATKAATTAAGDNNALQAQIFQQQRADLAPWRASGAQALTEINRRLGLGATSQGQGVAPIMGQSQVGMNQLTYQNDYANPAFYDGLNQQMMMAGERDPMQYDQVSASYGPGSAIDTAAIPYQTTQYQYQAPQAPQTTPQATAQPSNPSDPQNRYGGFYASPGYQFRMDEGTRGINANRAASGMLQSGDTLKALTRFGQDYASNEYNTQLNQLFSVAGLGQTATGQQNALASNYGANVSANNQNAANALSSSYANQGNIWQNALGNLGGYAAYSMPSRAPVTVKGK
jgi:hypothetical protein